MLTCTISIYTVSHWTAHTIFLLIHKVQMKSYNRSFESSGEMTFLFVFAYLSCVCFVLYFLCVLVYSLVGCSPTSVGLIQQPRALFHIVYLHLFPLISTFTLFLLLFIIISVTTTREYKINVS